MRLDSIELMLREQLSMLYSAETQTLLALPRVAIRAQSPVLVQAISTHVDQTLTHIHRLEHICTTLDLSCGGRRCLGMAGILKETDEVLGYGGLPALVDACIVQACQQVKQFEIVAYTHLLATLEQVSRPDLAKLARTTLDEEKATDSMLATLAAQLRDSSPALV